MECKICGKEFCSPKGLPLHLIRTHKISPKDYFVKYLNNNVTPTCYCGKEVNFIGVEKGFKTYCSIKCSANSPEVREKYKQTCREKFGEDNPNKNEKVKEKRKETNKKIYGEEWAFQNEEVKAKIRETNKLVYGYEIASQSERVKEKQKETNNERYGVDWTCQNEEVREKMKQTNLDRNGVENGGWTAESQEKIKETNLKNNGVEFPTQSEKVREKIKETNLEKFGEINPAQNEEIKNKIKKTHLKNFYNKLINSDRLKNMAAPLFEFEEYEGTKNNKYKWTCNQCNTEFEDSIWNGKTPRCPVCYPVTTGSSKMEKEVSDFCKQYVQVIDHDRTVLSNNQELDIYIPSCNLAIEFNGLYWHSEVSGGKDRHYHVNKMLECNAKGIKLIHIFENEWFDHQEIIKSIILHKLGKTKNKVFARKCEIGEIDSKMATEFFEKYHIQGAKTGINCGLFYENELIFLVSMGKSRFNKNYDYELLRVCGKTDYLVIGGLSRILKFLIKKYEILSIITYADARYGDGKAYLNSGFKFIHLAKPNYFYFHESDHTLWSRNKFQKHKLEKNLEFFDVSQTEWQNMKINKYDRIWDCGNYVFAWEKV